jgi:MFS family permease
MTAASASRASILLLTLLNTFAASFIWGINTLFLLDAGLNNLQAFGANAAFSAGMMLFEVPTGVVADMWGRRASFLLGAATLLVSTLLYLWMWQIHGPFWGWVVASLTIGLRFTFFSGAVEAWLVDALEAIGFEGPLESVFAKGQTTSGIAMLTGATAGGYIAQVTNLGVPYILRAAMLGITFWVALLLMRDLGFTPVHGANPITQMTKIVRASIDNGWRNPQMSWLMLAAPFSGGVGIYAFFPMQPYLLELWGDETAFGIAGLAAAIVAGAQIVGGLIAPRVRKFFTPRTHALLLKTMVSIGALAIIGLTGSFWVAIASLILWAIGFSVSAPIRHAYVNGIIPSEQRATVMSLDSPCGLGRRSGHTASARAQCRPTSGATPPQYLLSAASRPWRCPFSGWRGARTPPPIRFWTRRPAMRKVLRDLPSPLASTYNPTVLCRRR